MELFIQICLFPTERIFQVGKYLELRFEFRTSEMQGMILSVAEPVGFPAISIELHEGKVMLIQNSFTFGFGSLGNFFFLFHTDRHVL